jgi:hypothetical protein
MSCFELFAHGKSFDPDAYLASAPGLFNEKWYKGEYGSNCPATCGVRRRLGDGSVLDISEQERIAVEFLEAHRDALKELAIYPGIECFVLGLEIRTDIDRSTSAMSIGISPWLMWHTLDIGIKPVFYFLFNYREID